jgi:hypothetical protein
VGIGPWPSCGLKGCLLPATFKWETIEDGRPISVFLCPLHIWEIKKCLAEIASVREEERAFLEQNEGPFDPPATIGD